MRLNIIKIPSQFRRTGNTPHKMFLTFDWNVPATVAQNATPSQPSPQHQQTSPHPRTPNTLSHRTPLRRTVIEVEVAEKRERGTDEEGLTWIVETAPKHWLARSLIVRLTTNAAERGSGRLSMITRMTRHWISFKVHGTTPRTSLRVPIQWTKLSQVDQYEHMTQYASLSPYPLPLLGVEAPNEYNDEVTSPYEYDVKADDRYLARQLTLRNAGRIGRGESGHM